MGWPMGWLDGNFSVRCLSFRPVQPHGWLGDYFSGLVRRFECCGCRMFRMDSMFSFCPSTHMTPSPVLETRLPVEREVAAAVESRRALAAYLSTRFETQRITIFDEKNHGHAVELPTAALRLLVDILAELADGNAVKVVPVRAGLTTQDAADMLNVSRPHLVKLLESGALPFHKAGKHRRVRFADLMAFKAGRDRASSLAMEELARLVQEQCLEYE